MVDRYGNNQVKQKGTDMAPVDGGDETSGVGLTIVSGKKGTVTDKPIWSQQSSGDESGDALPEMSAAGSDSTDEKASYKDVQTDEGLPQTYRTSQGAGDAGVSGSDNMTESTDGSPDAQSVPSATSGEHALSDMPQTEFTHSDGGGAPAFKH